jgi:Xaa-Pro dipeptidase
LYLRRKKFIQLSTLLAGSFITAGFKSGQTTAGFSSDGKKIGLAENTISGISSISPDERRGRVAKAQSLMQQNNIRALVLESGTSLEYFTGISWWPSERTMAAVIPDSGEIIYICPGFEEARLQELITIGKKIYTWQEDENPFLQVVRAFSDAGIKSGKIGIEEEVRFFISDGIRLSAPQLEYVSGDPVTIPCRMFKSAAELALMQKASDITVAAIKKGMSHLKEGISQSEISDIVNEAHSQMGAIPDFALVLFGDASALPHGSIRSRPLKKGDIVLMDCGCRVEGYCSDITRTIVFGAEATSRQLEIWNLEQKAQAAGFAAARSGSKCEQVDAAARNVITDAGFGPGYKLPGLPHRTGHGIGMDGHEWGNMVKGNQQLLQPGMCFSIEPTIIVPGEFGIRLEDCVYMTSDGPKWFSQPAISIHKPFADMPYM